MTPVALFEDGPNLLIVGGDKLSRKLLHALGEIDGLKIFEDRSTSYTRVLRLIRRKSLRVSDVVKMALAEARRKRVTAPGWIDGSIASNKDLLEVIRHIAPRRVLLFRAGLIVNRSVLAEGVDIFNIHCASIKTHGGLASIRRALEDGAYDQVATLHRVTSSIDEGEEIATEPYRLDPNQSYFRNEEIAYTAGIALAVRLLKPSWSP